MTEVVIVEAGRSAIGKKKGSFAHVHPNGSVPMAALSLAQPGNPHAGHMMAAEVPSEVSFPYGFPKPGNYRGGPSKGGSRAGRG